jgi:hypothetical protein
MKTLSKQRQEKKVNTTTKPKKNCCTRTQTIDQFSLALSVVYDYDVLKNTRTGPPCPRRLFASDFKFSLVSPNTGKQKITFALVKPQTFPSPQKTTQRGRREMVRVQTLAHGLCGREGVVKAAI